jgi:hypothetical protein
MCHQSNTAEVRTEVPLRPDDFSHWPAPARLWCYEPMGTADFLIFLFAAMADLAALGLLRRMRRHDKLPRRVVRSLDAALRCQRIE